jgi:A/G-specific adenine glycosylase
MHIKDAAMDLRLKQLIRWYARNKRALPWRGTRNPYRILVSEIMLQQTQVDRVIDFYTKWLRLFPDWKSLAGARTDTLLRAWAGLGYNRRALQLRAVAQHVIAHGEPHTIDEWKKMKGVGPYTAAAVVAIVARKRTLVIDTNVRRVAGRLFLGKPHPVLADDQRIAHALERAVPRTDTYWELPQMFMDLGTAVCTSRLPACAVCPLRTTCNAAPAFLAGTVAKKPRMASRERKHGNKPHPDRIYRGRILAAVRTRNAQTVRTLGPVIDPTFDASQDAAWLNAIINRLVRDALLVKRGDRLLLPTSRV